MYVGRRPDGTMDDGAFTLGELEPHAEGLDDQQDVGEEDRRVDPESLHRLQGHFGGRLRVPAQLEKAEASAQGAVLRQIATGLAHEPHGRERGRLPPGGAQERKVCAGLVTRHAWQPTRRVPANQGRPP